MHPYRTRFKKEIVAEFLPPIGRRPKKNRVIIFCDGMPTTPRKRGLLESLAKKGYWVFHPRYRGTWESGGSFLRYSPEKDIKDVMDSLPRGFTEAFAHKKFRVKPDELFLFAWSFGGPAGLLLSKDKRVSKVVALSPVVDWKNHLKHGETIDWTRRFTEEAFGEAYRFNRKDWERQKSGRFYNPMTNLNKIDGRKVLIIHAKDDKVVPWRPVAKLARLSRAKSWLLPRGGHGGSMWFTKPRLYKKIAKFLKSK